MFQRSLVLLVHAQSYSAAGDIESFGLFDYDALSIGLTFSQQASHHLLGFRS